MGNNQTMKDLTAKEKARELLNKMNGQVITEDDWGKASDYAKSDLKRKVNIVVNEILMIYWAGTDSFKYWQEIKSEIEKLI